MPRPSTGARERIVAATVSLLRRGGLSAAGLNEVVASARAPKGSLYHYFPQGKAQMTADALEHYRGLVDAQLRAALGGRGALAHRVRRLFRSVDARMAVVGYLESCAVGAVVLDLGVDDGALRARCDDVLSHWSRTAAGLMPELPAARRGEAGRLLVTLLEGAQLRARAQGDGRPLSEAARAFAAVAAALSAPSRTSSP